ncbi:MAG TPA: hypothetical protein PLW81_05325 [Thiobacillaceae bacterium]|nr:hypothetical protein [Thiobacillaceae bacterium]
MSARRQTASKTASEKAKSKKKPGNASEPRLSRLRRPDDMAVDDWQVRLRRQYGREQRFEMENLGEEPIFSEFAITNPESRRRYRVVIRGAGLGVNFCSCPDFATNDLGTCKHIEFTLAALQRKRGAKGALKRGFQPPYSELSCSWIIPAAGGCGCGWARIARTPCGRRRALCSIRTPTGHCRARVSPGWTIFSARPARPGTSCAPTRMRWPLSPRRATPSGASRCWPRPIPRVTPVRPWAGCSMCRCIPIRPRANYETLARDLDLIQAWAPDVVIVDEAQRVKN